MTMMRHVTRADNAVRPFRGSRCAMGERLAYVCSAGVLSACRERLHQSGWPDDRFRRRQAGGDTPVEVAQRLPRQVGNAGDPRLLNVDEIGRLRPACPSRTAPGGAFPTGTLPRNFGDGGARRAGASMLPNPCGPQRAAALIRSTTTPGWLIMATCELLMFTVFAFARAAIARSASGGMIRSCFATRYQLGMVFHAGAPEGVTKAPKAPGDPPLHPEL